MPVMVLLVADDSGVAMAAGDHAAVDSALYDIDVHLIAVALHEIASHVLFDGFATAAIEILRDPAAVVVFVAPVRQHKVDDEGRNAALLLATPSMLADVHLRSSFQLMTFNP
ncbi:hypothetical protein PSAC2689_100060 [Paraburkholderia sacchari]